MTSVINRVQPIVESIVDREGYELVDMEYVREDAWYLRIYADKPGGITLDDCQRISQLVGEELDQMVPDPFPDQYYLEVSSPGAERPLKTAEEIAGAEGRYVHFDYYSHQEGEPMHEGTLLEVRDDSYILEVRDKTRLKQIEIPKSAVSKARLAVQF